MIKEKNIFYFGLYRIFSRMYFYFPIIFPLFYERGESILETEILLATYGLSVIFSSTTVKVFTNKFGHKNAIILGEFFKILGLICLIFYANNFMASIFSQLMMGIGYTLIVGNDTVILQQVFNSVDSNEYQNIQKKTNGYMFISVLFSSVIGALFFQHSSNFVLALSIIAAIFSIISISVVKYSLLKASKEKVKNLPIDENSGTYYFLIRSLTLPVFVGIFPYLFFVIKKIDMLYFATIIATFTLSGFFSSTYVTSHIKNRSLLFFTSGSVFLIIISISLLLFQNLILCLITACILGFVSGCVRPITISKINSNIYDVGKTLKSAEFNYGIFSSIILISAGIILEQLKFNTYIIILITVSVIYSSIKIYYQFGKMRNLT